MSVVQKYPDGTLTIFFSEPLDLMKGLTLVNISQGIPASRILEEAESFKSELFNITYFSSMEEENPNRPELLGSTVTELTSDYLKLKLNFKNELYVSSMYVPDLLDLQVKEPF